LGGGDKEPTDPAALVILASIALDQGNLGEAAKLSASLHGRVPGAAETKLLEALVDVRRSKPKGDWVGAAIEALRRVHPLAESTPLLDPWETSAALERPKPWLALAKLDLASSFLARWIWRAPEADKAEAESLVDDAIRLAAGDERLIVHLAVVQVLKKPPTGYRPDEAKAALDALAGRLAAKQPGALRLMLYPWTPASEPVTEADVAFLERAVAGEEPIPYAASYRELRDLFEQLDPAMAPSFAMSGSVVLVFERFQTRELHARLALPNGLTNASRRRLASALERLANLLLPQDTLLTRMLATVPLREAAKLTNDKKLAERAEALQRDGFELQLSSRCTEPLMRLPVAGLHRAWADRSLAEESQQLEKLRQAGLRCPYPELAGKKSQPAESAPTGQAGCPDNDSK